MTESKSNNENGSTKAFGGVLALVALIAGVYAMVQPMNQRIDFLERQIGTMNSRMEKDDECELVNAANNAAQDTKIHHLEQQLFNRKTKQNAFLNKKE